MSFAVDVDAVYYVASTYADGGDSSTLYVLGKADGGAASAIGSFAAIDLAVDATSIYFVSAGSIMSVSKTGGTPQLLGQGPGPSRLIGVDDTSVYGTSSTTTSSSIWATPKVGGANVLLAQTAPIAHAVLDGAGPASRRSRSCGFVDGAPPMENLRVEAFVTVGGCDESQSRVQMLVVVPSDEVLDPRASVVDRREGLVRVIGPVLERAEERFGKRIVVAHVRSAEGRQDAEAAQRRKERRGLHRRAVVRVQHELLRVDVFVGEGVLEHCLGVRRALDLLDAPADNLAAVDVEREVQEEEATAHERREIRDVPRPHAVGRVSAMRPRVTLTPLAVCP